jgi:hypothetical protein
MSVKRTYEVTVTETTIMLGKVTVEVESKEQAEEMACEKFGNGGVNLELDMDNGGVEFSADYA